MLAPDEIPVILTSVWFLTICLETIDLAEGSEVAEKSFRMLREKAEEEMERTFSTIARLPGKGIGAIPHRPVDSHPILAETMAK